MFCTKKKEWEWAPRWALSIITGTKMTAETCLRFTELTRAGLTLAQEPWAGFSPRCVRVSRRGCELGADPVGGGSVRCALAGLKANIGGGKGVRKTGIPDLLQGLLILS